jgi:hypothetical protein
MILTNRLFTRNPASREAKSIYIFCEGANREYHYFKYFREMDSRINIEIYKLNPHEDNSPQGLYKIALNSIVESEENPNPKYAFQENDEVWIVLDTDKDKGNSRNSQISSIRNNIIDKKDWFIVESNPCFEVWLYYHHHSTTEQFDGIEKCKNWKSYVDTSIKGGFDPRKHPIFIERATLNAENNFQIDENKNLKIGTTEVFKLSKSILTIVKIKIREILKKIE